MSQQANPPQPASPQPASPQAALPQASLPQPGSAAQELRMKSVTDLANDSPSARLDRIRQWVHRMLSSKPHIVALAMLGLYLVVLPLFGIEVSSKAELIGGNYTNVTSNISACIAAGGTLHLVNQGRKRQKVDAERLRLLKEVQELLHHVHPEAAAQLGQSAPRDHKVT